MTDYWVELELTDEDGAMHIRLHASCPMMLQEVIDALEEIGNTNVLNRGQEWVPDNNFITDIDG